MQGRIKETPEQLWQRKGKKFRTKYFAALKDLYGSIEHDKDCQIKDSESCDTNGRTRPDQISRLGS